MRNNLQNVIKKVKDIVQKSHKNDVNVKDEILSASKTSYITDLNALGHSESFFLENGDRSFIEETENVKKKKGESVHILWLALFHFPLWPSKIALCIVSNIYNALNRKLSSLFHAIVIYFYYGKIAFVIYYSSNKCKMCTDFIYL